MRLIYADTLKEKLQKHHDFYVKAWGNFSDMPLEDKARVDEIINCIASIVNSPTIDAEPVRHGRWAQIGSKCSHRYKCSECGKIAYCPTGHSTHNWRTEIITLCNYQYCPNCGADMRSRNDGEK